MQVPFKLKIQGDDADQHQMPAYDGYIALAGFAWMLSLTSNYAETGIIRHRGDFIGRSSVKAKPIEDCSIIADFLVSINQSPFIATAAGVVTLNVLSSFVYDLVRRTMSRNIGQEIKSNTSHLANLEDTRGGDLEALVAAVEPAIKQSHMVIVH